MNKFEWIAAKIILGSCIIIAFIVLIAGIVNIVIKSGNVIVKGREKYM